MGNIRAQVTVHGRVQGVAFRYSTIERAEELGLTGWVRNTDERTVEAVFEGPEENVKEMVKWCHRGPLLARVTKVDSEYSNATGEFGEFGVRF